MSLLEFFHSHPGYLKKSAAVTQIRLNNQFSIEEIEIAKKAIKNLAKKIIRKNETKDFEQPGMYISFGCMHVPFHNKKLFNCFLDFLTDYSSDIKGLIIGGDFLDMNALSAHDRGSIGVGITLEEEYKEGNKILDKFDSILPNAKKAFLYGNHCDRYKRYMKDANNMKLGKALISPELALKLKERGYIVKTDWKNDFLKVGKHLDVYHGEFYNLYPAKKALDTYKSSALFYHSHRTSCHVEGDMAAYNGGCMADINSKVFSYATKAQRKMWSNGFNIIHIDQEGCFNIQQVVYYNNKFYFGNKEYS